MQRMLVLTPPYGTAFMFAPPPMNGGPHGVWLRYDSASDSEVIAWLKNTLTQLEAQTAAYNRAQVPPEPAEPVESVKIATPSHSLLSAIAAMPTKSGHDWGGPYKIGLTCKKCGQKSDGLEKSCVIARWRPGVGDEVLDKRPNGGEIYVVEAIAENDRFVMVDGPILHLSQIAPIDVPNPDETPKT